MGDGMGWWLEWPFLGRPDFWPKPWKHTAFFHKIMQNRGAPKTAVLPTTTHPIPHSTSSALVARAVRNAIRANRFARIIRN